jgi:hypothetical protein
MKTLLTVEVERKEDLMPLVTRLKVPYSTKYSTGSEFKEASALDYNETKKKLNALASKDNVSSFGDAAAYQRAIRKDSKMPFRNE